MKSFFWGYGDETPGSVEPSGEHTPAFKEVHRNGQHSETWNNHRKLAEQIPSLTTFPLLTFSTQIHL